MAWQKLIRPVSIIAAIFGTVSAAVAGCGGSSSGGDVSTLPPITNTEAGIDGKASGGNDTICLLNDCDVDRDCKDCSGSRTVCDQKAHRCIACGANANGATCANGQYCTQYGDCAPNGVTCAVDTSGNPTIKCSTSKDCVACDPNHQVCSAAGACVGCTTDDVTNCQSTDICTATNTCAAACPSACTVDTDCAACDAKGKVPATACNKHLCAQCSATSPCASGECDLDHGTCTPTCGTSGGHPVAGNAQCKVDADCMGCQTTTSCQLPIGGGTGTCVVPATGCSDLGKGVVVLPAPFNEVTNACSTDTDCASINANINIGGILRNLTGVSAIKDANIPYPMHACAAVTIKGLGSGGDGGAGLSCGICVPCRVDTDCADIDIDKVAGAAFGDIGSIAASILLDQVFGPSDHQVHMYCDDVAQGYGVCLPCSDILHACGDGKNTGQTSGKCDHDACAEGSALDGTCDTTAKDVCAHDAYCCTTEWDTLCVDEVDQFAKQQACTAVSCADKDDGTYCTPASTGKNPGESTGGYVCQNHSILGGTVGCSVAGQKCVLSDPSDIKSPAKTLAESDGGALIVCQ